MNTNPFNFKDLLYIELAKIEKKNDIKNHVPIIQKKESLGVHHDISPCQSQIKPTLAFTIKQNRYLYNTQK